MVIKILGAGCSKCEQLSNLAKQAVDELDVTAEIIKVKDLNDILDFGIVVTPGLVINDDVKSAGKLPAIDQIKTWIKESL